MGLPPVRRPKRFRRGPESTAVPTGRLLGSQQIGWRGEPVKDPGVAFGDQLVVEIALVNPEGTQQPVVLVTAVRFQPDGLSLYLLCERRAGLPAVGLAVFRGVNPQQTNPFLSAVCRHCRDGVAIMHRLNGPGFSWQRTGPGRKAFAEQACCCQHDNQPKQS